MHDDLRKQFAHLDRDGSGHIEPSELLTANPPATEACEACGALAGTAAGPVE